MLFYVLGMNKVFSFLHTLHLSPSSPTPWQNLLTRSWTQQRRWSCAEPSRSRAFFCQQQEKLAASRRAYVEVSLQLNQLVERLDQLQVIPSADRASTSASGPEGAVPRHAEPRLNPPAPYSGEPNYFRLFLSQCSLNFQLSKETFIIINAENICAAICGFIWNINIL